MNHLLFLIPVETSLFWQHFVIPLLGLYYKGRCKSAII